MNCNDDFIYLLKSIKRDSQDSFRDYNLIIYLFLLEMII